MKKFFLTAGKVSLGIFIAGLLLVKLVPMEKKNAWVFVDGQQIVVSEPTWRSTEGILRNAGVTLGKNDSYVVAPGNIIEVIRAVPVNLIKDGVSTEIWTGEATVVKALQKIGIATGGMNIYPGADRRPIAGMDIVLLQPGETVVRKTLDIPYAVVNRPDSHMELGDSAVIFEGVTGSKDVLVQLLKLANGSVVEKNLGEKVTKQPQDKIVAMGTTNTVETSRGAVRFTKVIKMQATAYTPWDEGCIGITKNGMVARRGLVAVDPDVIPLGTRLYVPGYGMALAADIGGAIQGNRIDLCMESLDEAFQYGRRNIKVYILE